MFRCTLISLLLRSCQCRRTTGSTIILETFTRKGSCFRLDHSQFKTSNKKFHWRGHVCLSGITSRLPSIDNKVTDIKVTDIKHCVRTYHRHGVLLCVQQNPTNEKETTAKGQKIENVDGKDVESKENIFTVPNLLTGFRIVATPYLGYLVLHDNFVPAMTLFAVAAVTDGLDGYIARNFKNQSSTLGSLIDPLADKLLVSVLSITLTMANLIPVVLMAVIVGRDVLLLVAALGIKYTSVPPPRTLYKVFDARNATVQMLPSTLSKVNTAVQLTLLTVSLGAPVFGYIDHPVLHVLWYVTGATTIASGVGYAVTGRKNVRYIEKETRKKS